MLEWYQAYADYRDGMELIEQVVAPAGAAAGSTLDLTPPWPRRPLREAITEEAGIDPMADRDPERLVALHARAGRRRVRRPHLGAVRSTTCCRTSSSRG